MHWNQGIVFYGDIGTSSNAFPVPSHTKTLFHLIPLVFRILHLAYFQKRSTGITLAVLHCRNPESSCITLVRHQRLL